ncbi:MAG: class I SAM-dependent methyltransferase [Trueperaceae bacterium]|nr:MAG: class I SAM-dependent methyltransferase [Trueperaceae bacterium]
MSNNHPIDSHNATSGGKMSEARYLDDHYEATKVDYEQMLRSVGIEKGWNVLDAGGGGGSYLRLLTELVGDSGTVMITDLASENVQHVAARIDRGEFRCRVETRTANVVELPFPDDAFDAVWCAAVTQYLSDDEVVTAFNEFKRVVRPGGLVAIKEGDITAWHFGPFPSAVIWRSFIEYMDRPERGFMRAPKFAAMFRAAGLENIVSRTTLIEKYQPLSPVERRFIREAFKYMSSLNLKLDLSDDDKEWWLALSNVDDPQHILNDEDFFYREPHNVTVGRVPTT